MIAVYYNVIINRIRSISLYIIYVWDRQASGDLTNDQHAVKAAGDCTNEPVLVTIIFTRHRHT